MPLIITYHSDTMKRTLASLLLIINLFSGIAFAWDSHPEAMVAGDMAAAVELLSSADADHPDAADFDHCDHCCHGAAHLIGILYEDGAPLLLNGHETGAYAALALPSLYITPLLRPPIA
ncbi:MAG TPA: hypothetical protein ENK35_09580 [Candidatus Tenderia sp.]|nr:hypothetical protein [Candidatus Tenderia sp.]